MSDELNQYLGGLLAALRAEEVTQIQQYCNATAIDDMAEALAATIGARTKIQKLRQWVEELQRVKREVDELFPATPPLSQPINETPVDDAPQSVPDVKEQSDENILTSQNTGESVRQNQSPEPLGEQAPAELVSEARYNEADQTALEGFTLIGKRYAASNWQEVLVKLCEAMILIKPYKMASFGINDHAAQTESRIFSLSEPQIISGQKLTNGLFVDIGGSGGEIKKRCEHILLACGYNSDALQVL